MGEEEVAVKSRYIHVTILTVAVKSSGDISAELVRGQKIEEHVVTDLDLRNDENRPSLTSGAVAEERQEVSSKSTIDETLTLSLEATISVSSQIIPLYCIVLYCVTSSLPHAKR